jgi:hypothetical protein
VKVPLTFTIEQTTALISSLLALPEAQFAEPNMVVTKSCPSITTPASVSSDASNLWGLDRIDQVAGSLNGQYQYSSGAAKGVHVFVVDTGVKVSRRQCERAPR